MGALTTMLILDGRQQGQVAMDDNRRQKRPDVQRDQSFWEGDNERLQSIEEKKSDASQIRWEEWGANVVLFLGRVSKTEELITLENPMLARKISLQTHKNTVRIRAYCTPHEREDVRTIANRDRESFKPVPLWLELQSGNTIRCVFPIMTSPLNGCHWSRTTGKEGIRGWQQKDKQDFCVYQRNKVYLRDR